MMMFNSVTSKAMSLVLAIGVLLLSACAAKPVSPIVGEFKPASPPGSDAALIYIHYPYQEVADSFPATVILNDEEVATLQSGTHTRFYSRPGQFTLKTHWCSKWENAYCPGDLLAKFDFDPGKTYQIRIKFDGHKTSSMYFIGYAPVQSAGYADIHVSYEIDHDLNLMSMSKRVKPNKEHFEAREISTTLTP